MRLDYKWRVAIVAALGMFMSVLDLSIVNVALPQMQHAFQTDFETITWVATAYFLAQAAVTPVTGYLSDVLGSKMVFIAALALFTITSLLCALAPTKETLIAFRVLQGVGGGALFPLGFAMIFRVFPVAERGPSSALIGLSVLLAPVLGPTIGGYLTTSFDWHAIFMINLPLGLLDLLLAALILRGKAAEQTSDNKAPSARRRFDLAGLALAVVGFTALVYGITQAGARGWSDLMVDGALIAGGVALVLLVFVELRVSAPVLDVRLFRRYAFTMANLLNWFLGAALFGSLFLLPLFFENVQGKTPLAAGAILAAQGAGAAVATFIAGALYNRVGPRILVTLGFVSLLVATLGLNQLAVDSSWQSLLIWLVLRGAALGFANVPLQTLALSVVSNQALARASSLVTATRLVFSALGVAVLTTYLTQQAHTYGNQITAGFQSRPPTGIAATCLASVGQHLPALKACATQHATVLGLNDTFTLLAFTAGVCVLLALLVGRDPAVDAARRAAKEEKSPEPAQPVRVGE